MLALIPDTTGKNTYGKYFTYLSWNFLITAGNVTSITIPNDYSTYEAFFTFSPGTGVWVGYNFTPAIPTSVVVQSVQEHLPQTRFVKKGDTLSFITSYSASEVGVVLGALTR